MVATAKLRVPRTWNQSSGNDWITLAISVASLLYVLALGLGLHRSSEGIVCAVLITANEVFYELVRAKRRLLRPRFMSRFTRDTAE